MASGTSSLIFQAMKNAGAHTTLNNPYQNNPNINYVPNALLDTQIANTNQAFNAPIYKQALPVTAPKPTKYTLKP